MIDRRIGENIDCAHGKRFHRQNGVDLKTVRFIEMPYSSMDTAIVAGRVDAAMMEEAALDKILATDARLFAHVHDAIDKNFSEGAFFATADFVKTGVRPFGATSRTWSERGVARAPGGRVIARQTRRCALQRRHARPQFRSVETRTGRNQRQCRDRAGLDRDEPLGRIARSEFLACEGG